MYKKITCLHCGFRYFISNKDLIEIEGKMYSQCRLCDALKLHK